MLPRSSVRLMSEAAAAKSVESCRNPMMNQVRNAAIKPGVSTSSALVNDISWSLAPCPCAEPEPPVRKTALAIHTAS